MTLGAGETFAGYTILGQLGAGGMGEVYLAQHPRLPRKEALKILRPDISADAGFRQRFIREADAIAALEHPHIVTVYDRGDTDGQLWIATQYIDGTDAAQILARRYPTGMPPNEVAEITTGVAAALDYAHAHGLLHRDVKPANILLSKPDTDGQRRIYLADFGIARPLDDPAGLTATGFTVGTVAYASPEQLAGNPLDGRSDQYALAATAYQLLTGTTPFPNSNPIAVISAHLTQTPPPPSTVRPALGDFDPVFARALAKNPQDRFARCQDFAHALTAATAGGSSATAPTQLAPTPPRTSPPRQTRPSATTPTASTPTPQRSWGSRRLAIVGGVSVIGMLGIGGVLFANSHRAGNEVHATTASGPHSSSITGTCDQQKICHGAKQRTDPKNDAPQLVPDILPEGAAVEISCQIRGELKTETDHAPSDLWYRLTNGAYINSIYITPPGTEIPACTVGATAAPPPLTTTTPQPTTTTNASLPVSGGAAYVITPTGKTACRVAGSRVDCYVEFNATASREIVDGKPMTGVAFSPDGSMQWLTADRGDHDYTTLEYGSKFQALNWTIKSYSQGTIFTNDTTGMGMMISAQGFTTIQPGSPTDQGNTPTEGRPCTDKDKIIPSGNGEMICDIVSTGPFVLQWRPFTKTGLESVTRGASCAPTDVSGDFRFARSTDDYLVWCVGYPDNPEWSPVQP